MIGWLVNLIPVWMGFSGVKWQRAVGVYVAVVFIASLVFGGIAALFGLAALTILAPWMWIIVFVILIGWGYLLWWLGRLLGKMTGRFE